MSFPSEPEFVKHKRIAYEKDTINPEYIKRLWVDDKYTITFYPYTDVQLQVYNKATGTIYELKTRRMYDYTEPWFSEVDEIEKKVKEHGEDYTVEWILRTLRDYFNVTGDS